MVDAIWRLIRRLTEVAHVSALFVFAIGVGLQSATAQNVSAQSAERPSRSATNDRSGVAASIVTDGALVFATSDTTSAVIAQLPAGRSVRVSKGTLEGVDGVFRRIIVGKRIGYILTDDVAVGEPSPKASPKTPQKAGEKSSDEKPKKKPPEKPAKKSPKKPSKKSKKDSEKKREPIYFTRFVGVLIGQSEFKEDIANVDAGTSLTVYGLKITGPDVLVTGPIIDFNLALHYGAPSYYDTYSEIRPTGFVLFTDALLVIPFSQAMDSLFYFNLGPALVYSQFNVMNSGRLMDLKNLNLGLSMALGGAYRIDKVALRLEGKYLIEKNSYKALQASVQYEF